jgi:hypothetical protein
MEVRESSEIAIPIDMELGYAVAQLVEALR